jgi:N-acetylneuraminic acid mutarotase
MGAAVGDSLFLLGGLNANGVSSSDVYRIQPSTGNVTLAGLLSTPTHGAAAVTLGQQVLVFGGADVSPDSLVQAFDPATGTTTVIGHMPGPRADLVGAAVGNEVVLLAGFNGSAFLSDVWATPDGTSFSVAGQIAAVERYPAIAAVGTKIYLFGGLVAGGEYNGTFSTTVQSFDVATRQAHVVGQLPTPLAHARAAVLDGQVLVFGGWTPAGPSSAILRFDPTTGTLSQVGTLPGPVADEAIGTVGNTVYLASGLAASTGGALRPLVQVVGLSLGATP